MKVLDCDKNFNFGANWFRLHFRLVDVETITVGWVTFRLDFKTGEYTLTPCTKLKRLSGKEKGKLWVVVSSLIPQNYDIMNKGAWNVFLEKMRKFSGLHNCPCCNEIIPSNKKYCSDKCKVKAFRTREKENNNSITLNGLGG